ncbi:hypothetical protein FI667_g9570, partial [Globisporangium splendens]
MNLKARPIATLISDQKVQDVVDKVFPEYKKRDRELETEFYERHSFKRKKVVEPSSSIDDAATAGTTLAAVKVVWNGQKQQPASTDSSPSSSVATTASKTTPPSAASDASGNAASTPVQSAHEAAVTNGSPTDKAGAKRPLKFAQMPLSNWSMTIVKLFTIEVYPEQDNEFVACGFLMVSYGMYERAAKIASLSLVVVVGCISKLHGLPELPLPFLHVDGRFKMFELRKYIARRLKLEELAEDLEITCLGAIGVQAVVGTESHQSPSAVIEDTSGTGINGYRMVPRDQFEFSPEAYSVYAGVCNFVAANVDTVVEVCMKLGYNVTMDKLRIVPGGDNTTMISLANTLPVIALPYYDNSPNSRFAMPGSDGSSCVFRLAGTSQGRPIPFYTALKCNVSMETTLCDGERSSIHFDYCLKWVQLWIAPHLEFARQSVASTSERRAAWSSLAVLLFAAQVSARYRGIEVDGVPRPRDDHRNFVGVRCGLDTQFFRSDIALRLNGNAKSLLLIKVAVCQRGIDKRIFSNMYIWKISGDSSATKSRLLTGYELVRLGYVVFGDDCLISIYDWYSILLMSPTRLLQPPISPVHILVFQVARDLRNGCYDVNSKPKLCRMHDEQLLKHHCWKIYVGSFY